VVTAAGSDDDAALNIDDEDAAAAVVGDAAEAEEDDDADAMDEEADASRFDPNDPDHHPLSNMPPPSSDVDIGQAFADGLKDGKKLVLGKTSRVIIGFANNARVSYHVWGVMGSLNMPHNFDIHVQNFTYAVINQTVASGGELSFDYSFEPNERLDTRDFTLALSVFYEAQSTKGNVIRAHSTTFYNETIVTEAGPQVVNNAAFVAILIVILAAAGGGLYYMKTVSDHTKRSATEMGTTSSSATEWLEDHNSMLTGGGRTKSKTK
jgi:Translocon-associated protein (TRAP), alpha subunit